MIDFSSLIPAIPTDPEWAAYLADRITQLSQYPEREPLILERMIAAHRGVPPECVMVTAGITDAVYIIAQAFSSGIGGYRKIPAFAIDTPAPEIYAQACQTFGYQRVSDVSTTTQYSILWTAVPNMVNGRVGECPFVSSANLPHVVYVVDASLERYALGSVPTPQQCLSHANVIRLQSFSTTYGVPGLRLGYVIAAKSVIARLRRFRRPYSVNTLAITAGKFLISRQHDDPHAMAAYLEEAQHLNQQLNAIAGLTAESTDTHVMLCRIQRGTTDVLAQHLDQKNDISIRTSAGFTGLDLHHFRVTAQTPEVDDLLVTALSIAVPLL